MDWIRSTMNIFGFGLDPDGKSLYKFRIRIRTGFGLRYWKKLHILCF